MTDLFVDSSGVRLAVRDYGGDGRALVFVHGGPGPNLTSWDDFAPRMIGQFRAIAYDQRGHGQSSNTSDYSYTALAGDIQAIVDALHLDAPIVVGHSWGGQIALIYAATYPDCAGVVAVDGLITGEYRKPSAEQWAWLENELRTNPVISRTADFVGTPEELEELLTWIRTAAPFHYPEFSEEAFRRNLVVGPDGLLHSRHTPDQFVAMNRAVVEQGMPSIEIYERITCPVMLIIATTGMFSHEAVEQVQERFPKSRVEWLSCGHAVQQERPDELDALITDFASS